MSSIHQHVTGLANGAGREAGPAAVGGGNVKRDASNADCRVRVGARNAQKGWGKGKGGFSHGGTMRLDRWLFRVAGGGSLRLAPRVQSLSAALNVCSVENNH